MTSPTYFLLISNKDNAVLIEISMLIFISVKKLHTDYKIYKYQFLLHGMIF